MKTFFKSQELRDLVEKGYAEKDEAQRLQENNKEDSTTQFCIQQAVHDSIFPIFLLQKPQRRHGISGKRISQLNKCNDC